jgi:hypothetical protein
MEYILPLPLELLEMMESYCSIFDMLRWMRVCRINYNRIRSMNGAWFKVYEERNPLRPPLQKRNYVHDANWKTRCAPNFELQGFHDHSTYMYLPVKQQIKKSLGKEPSCYNILHYRITNKRIYKPSEDYYIAWLRFEFRKYYKMKQDGNKHMKWHKLNLDAILKLQKTHNRIEDVRYSKRLKTGLIV